MRKAPFCVVFLTADFAADIMLAIMASASSILDRPPSKICCTKLQGTQEYSTLLVVTERLIA
jgi:hypothetical protein